VKAADIYQHYLKGELQDYCRDNDLKVSGTSKELIERIVEHLEGDGKENKSVNKPVSKVVAKKAATKKVTPKKKEAKEESDEENTEDVVEEAVVEAVAGKKKKTTKGKK